MKRCRGISLVELIFVMAFGGLLMLLLIVTLNKTSRTNRDIFSRDMPAQSGALLASEKITKSFRFTKPSLVSIYYRDETEPDSPTEAVSCLLPYLNRENRGISLAGSGFGSLGGEAPFREELTGAKEELFLPWSMVAFYYHDREGKLNSKKPYALYEFKIPVITPLNGDGDPEPCYNPIRNFSGGPKAFQIRDQALAAKVQPLLLAEKVIDFRVTEMSQGISFNIKIALDDVPEASGGDTLVIRTFDFVFDVLPRG